MPNIINISNRLPVTVGETITKSSGGLVSALEGVAPADGRLRWIGWPGAAVDQPSDRQRIEHLLDKDYGFVPVFLSSEQVEAHYDGFSNASLWPLLHYMPTKFRYEPGWWKEYEQVNRMFRDAALAAAQPNDLVWVHDYHLMLLPAMLREKMPSLKIGFFLHTPFPSYEVFRCHPNRDELIRGVLGAELIGFHTFGYMRHFRSAVLRLLGIESEMTRIRFEGHTTTIGVYPIGINAAKFDEQLAKPEHDRKIAGLAPEDRDKQLVVSVERMDYTKGILHRLSAIETFLESRTDRDSVKFLFVSVPSREEVKEYQDLRDEVARRIGSINGKYATLRNSPIHFIHGSVGFEELCALYAMSDAAIITPLIDGMNLVAKEFIACQKDDPGVLILSEFAGAAEELFNALIVNPYNAPAVAQAIEQALSMPLDERKARLTPMRQRVMRFDAQWWARQFIQDLKAIEVEPAETPSLSQTVRQISDTVQQGKRIALFLDYDGTLREIERDPAMAAPNAAVQSLLKKLSTRDDLNVTLISGRGTYDMEHWFGSYPFGLIAEHGAMVIKAGEQQWTKTDHSVNYTWKTEILKLLRQFEDQTPGSFVEEKRTSVVWHYRKSDAEFGEYKARLLAGELATLAANEPIVVRHGTKIVEVAAIQINKGAAVKAMVEAEPCDLIVVAGDDITDESMFKLELPNLISIKVGPGETAAKLRLASPAQFRRMLEMAVLNPKEFSPALAEAAH